MLSAAAPPAVVLASDPTATLEANDSRMFFETLRKLGSEGAAIILTTTSPRTARVADQVFHLEQGRFAGRDSATGRA